MAANAAARLGVSGSAVLWAALAVFVRDGYARANRTSTSSGLSGAIALDDAEVEQLVTSGVRIFLRAYRPDTGT